MAQNDSETQQAKDAPLKGPELIRSYVRTLPGTPGVYRMLDTRGEVLYVGKALNLKNRVSSYTRLHGHSNRIANMIIATAGMEFVTTPSESEALLLEANLIKRYKPPFNVLMRDDKSFPYILLSKAHEAVRLMKHRGAQKIKGDYFGPFASAGSVNRTLNTLQRIFLLRSCTDAVYQSRTRPCLLFQIKRCAAPCTGEITIPDYNALVAQARAFLSGKSFKIQDDLAKAMEKASAAMEYEQAAVYRDRLAALTNIQAHQGINPRSISEADVFAVTISGGQACVQVFFFRANQNWGNRAYFPRIAKEHGPEEILNAFLAQFYDGKPCPRLVLLSHTPPDGALIAEALSLKAGRKVKLLTPRRGDKLELVQHVTKNAEDALARRMAESATQRRLLDGVQNVFDLDAPPERIETYDNSHIQGSHAIGAMVVAGPDGFEKKHYRTFNIKDEELTPGDDFGMMREVLTRRFRRLAAMDNAERESAGWPDLVLIDGGAGQLSAAQAVLDELGVGDVTLVGIAKGPERNAGRERFFMAGRAPFMLEPRDPVLYYLQRLRDEAHRFAIGTHRARRKSAQGKSALDEVPGVGAARKRALLRHFGSAKAVSRAGAADLASVKGISAAMAQQIFDYFHGGDA